MTEKICLAVSSADLQNEHKEVVDFLNKNSFLLR